jgi:hypothetical protein
MIGFFGCARLSRLRLPWKGAPVPVKRWISLTSDLPLAPVNSRHILISLLMPFFSIYSTKLKRFA